MRSDPVNWILSYFIDLVNKALYSAFTVLEQMGFSYL
jgi:hypothetical protein